MVGQADINRMDSPSARSACASSRPIPILYIARGGNIDGAGRQLLYLLQHLDRVAFEPVVFLDEPGEIFNEIESLNIKTYLTPMRPWRSLRGWPYRFFDVKRALKLAAAHSPAIVHCSDPWRAPYASRIARARRVPLVTHVRGPTRPRDLEKNHCLGADAIIGIAERYRSDIHTAGYPKEKTHVIDDAVDPSIYKPNDAGRAAARASLGIGTALAVGLVGRIEPLKRVIEFLEAAARVPHTIDATFLLIGAAHKPEYTQQVHTVIHQLGMQDRVRLIGRRDDMQDVLSALDLMVTLSGGSVMFEAMACGTCVLSVRPDGRHSQHTIHQQTAWCVTTNDAKPAADAMALLLTDPALRHTLAAAGRSCVIDRLSPLVMAQKTQAIYQSLLHPASEAMAWDDQCHAV